LDIFSVKYQKEKGIEEEVNISVHQIMKLFTVKHATIYDITI